MKPRLFTPGPTPVPEETLLELAKPVTYHRSPEAKAILAEVTEDLKYVFQTAQPVFTLTCSGTGGMEAAVANTLAAGEKAILCTAGRWGERWRGILKAFGANIVAVEVPYGKAVTPEMLATGARREPGREGRVRHAERDEHRRRPRPRGVRQARREDRRALRRGRHQRPGRDGVPRRCVEHRRLRDRFAEGADAAAGAGVRVGQREGVEEDRRDARAELLPRPAAVRKSLAESDTPFTPANTLIRAQRASLKRIRAEGIENLWARHAKIAAACRAGVKAMGLEVFAERPNNALTVITVPAGVDGSATLKKLEKQYGYKLADGQDTLKGKIWRLSHMGYTDAFDVLGALGALELVLLEAGFKLEAGAGVAAFQRAYAAAQ